MKWKTEYLSEKELQMLISEVEQRDMVAAPPELAENILSCITEEGQEQESQLISVEHKKKEYRSYCFRVWTSVAAAIAFIFILPGVMNLQFMQKIPLDKNTDVQEGVLFEWTYKDTEENQKETEVFRQLFSGYNIFDSEDKLQIFKK